MADTVRAFERGLAVVRSFGRDTPTMTLSEVARATDLSRATARRLLLTLEGEGYVRQRGDTFALTPRVLDLGFAFISSFGLPELAVPALEQLSAELEEASSVAVLDGPDVVYVARVPAKRVMTVSIGLGTRFPAYRTSLGRVLLAELTDDEVRVLWERSDRSGPTSRTVATLDDLLVRLVEVRDRGWAMVDQELEMGVRSVAVPIRNGRGRAVGAVNVSTHTSRTTKAVLRSRFVPAVVAAAQELSATLARQTW